MPKEPRRDSDSEEREDFWRGLGKDVLLAAAIVAVVLAGLWAYAGNWPPLVVVESSSMQHGDLESNLGVIDTGDMVFQQVAPNRADVVTYLEGRARNYMTYGDFGDVIIFRRAGMATPVIHRAIMFVTLHSNGTADVPDVTLLPDSEWTAIGMAGPTRTPTGLCSLTIRHMGFERNINMTFTFGCSGGGVELAGYVTMGDNNSFTRCAPNPADCRTGYDPLSSIPRLEDVQGRARGEIPWLGLIKLTLAPTNSCCPAGWADPRAPHNSWDALLVTLIVLISLPFLLELAGRGWKKYVSPRLPEVRWPWRRRAVRARDPVDSVGDPDAWDEPLEGEERPPREGWSGP